MVLYNRQDCCSERLNNFQITVGSSRDGEGNGICVSDGGNVSQKIKIINNCEPPLLGRYVHVKLMGSSRRITICEIEVYASEGKNSLFLSFIILLSLIRWPWSNHLFACFVSPTSYLHLWRYISAKISLLLKYLSDEHKAIKRDSISSRWPIF